MKEDEEVERELLLLHFKLAIAKLQRDFARDEYNTQIQFIKKIEQMQKYFRANQ